MNVVGLDPSLTSFGAAVLRGDTVTLNRFRCKERGHARLDYLLKNMWGVVTGADLVVMEGLAFGAKGSAFLDLAGLHWLIRHDLYRGGVPYAVVPPSSRAKWLTGRGNATKDECLAASIRRFPGVNITGNDEADALTLAAMGRAWLGRPYVTMPTDRHALLRAVNRKGQPAIAWPDEEKITA